MSRFMAEFLGTMLLIMLGDGVVACVSLNKSKGQNGGWIVVTTSWAIAVAVPALIFGAISGAHFNPAVTIAFAATNFGGITWAMVPSYIIAQMLGAMLGAAIVWIAYLPHWAETEDPAVKLGVFATAPAIRNSAANLVTEIIGTFVLVFTIMGLSRVDQAPGIGVYSVGLVILVIGLALGGPTGYAINPARDLGPRIAHAILPIAGKGGSDWGYSWIPVVGPIIGGLIGAFVFTMVFPV
ncbi:MULTISPECIES: MIP/aquaporin family protein [Clostridium]|uniref:Glycerol uptake facilitator protein n=1 Tax=Clostridium novyi (strain NT) TaxID=386415 RepID=A0Q373_CLONN|nr:MULTISPECIES: MIP/aquaporin family protein [Clostridium]ABK61123.1 glycerol uptake facilitator protein [Clostridium novyi NT]KEH87531.1 glycerol transporter [Clostridium novyi A str. NCTC 538]KEH88298.1 glycerol transporter [Clostridium novyi A str. 4540]KEH91163.1 glycerol transporter [Clostridium novyi A str. BKT29909]KEH94826.1 glycerol transporter [Clostridium botulinum C/D str. It1]